MPWTRLDDRDSLRAFCLRDPRRYAFHLTDIDDSEWSSSDYYAWPDAAAPRELLLVYGGLSRPCVHALGRDGRMGPALREALPLFPDEGYLHIGAADLALLEEHLRIERHGAFQRMAWDGFPAGAAADAARARRRDAKDVDELAALLAASYPGTYFEPSQLAKGVFFGVEEEGRLLACAGVHALSEREGIAVLGNIATLPARRNEGLGRAATAALLARLRGRVRWVLLNVHTDNEPARRLYRRLGFRDLFVYEEAAFGPASRAR